ncbi:hypothetical protein A3K93_09890 [Acinetobacter sp. NCu2D-2]|uniref:hypothetical protein n=1 Tax=Acinetobacter sp. NCu2D-2 TaxID=1608473 RepID=UPI0007CDE535|nr:hypothetical protein [Acinetobacter sp. NCu2D-2]ANF83162.1 hypothetical protein A3K93_09890 [Acinetobacter sp. NCu2D-2]
MKSFFLNATRIVETNPKVYWSIILGVVACLALFVAEIVHIQNVLTSLNTHDLAILSAAIDPIASSYKWARIFAILAMVVWSSFEYSKTKKQLGLK